MTKLVASVEVEIDIAPIRELVTRLMASPALMRVDDKQDLIDRVCAGLQMDIATTRSVDGVERWVATPSFALSSDIVAELA